MALASTVHASQADATPVQKVIMLLQGMLEKSKKVKADEEVTSKRFDFKSCSRLGNLLSASCRSCAT